VRRQRAVGVLGSSAVRWGGGIVTAFGVALVSMLGSGVVPAIAHELTAPFVSTGVDDFSFDSVDVAYTLGRDADGRSTLHVREHFVAVFPDIDQNRGFGRDLVHTFDGHDTELNVLSVTDENGSPRPYELQHNGDFLTVAMAVPEGSFVHGVQSYVLEYTQRDVTLRPDDADVDEFSWDLTGTDTRQPVAHLTATVTVDADLVSALNGDAACYRGYFGSDGTCVLTADGGTFSVDETELMPYENVTLSLGFARGTFAERPAPFLERVPVLLYAGLASLVGAIGAVIVTVVRARRGPATGRAIIAQFEPPEGVDVATAAQLLHAAGKGMTATLLDFAVRRRVRLLHDEASGLYGAQALTGDGLDPVEALAYRQLFAGGATLWFTRASTRLGDAAAALRSRARNEAKHAGYLRRVRPGVLIAVAVMLVLALLLPVLHAILTGNFALMTVLLAVGINLIVWVLLFTLGGLAVLRVRTESGALLHDHLMGLREYIRLAEADRIRMLQSASGAEVDEQRIVQVYERLLPYAVLFGFETEWQGELARYYRETPPEWVTGASTFSTALPLHTFHSVVSTSRVTVRSSSGHGSGSSFSSSHSSSSGGGFSGGGGGGGGTHGI